MALNVPTTEVTKKWPPEEYYHVRRPMEEWVPPLEVLEQMQSDEPHRFREYRMTHEKRCMSFYQKGKTREEVFREVSSVKSEAEARASREEEKRKFMDKFFPSLEEREAKKQRSAGGFKRLKDTSQGFRFDVPPMTWIEEELIVCGARSGYIAYRH
jgi:hypothetical protein